MRNSPPPRSHFALGRFCLCVGLLLALGGGPAIAADKPNIIVILSDDYGWGSVGCYGATGVKTPHLDRLAREGRRFTHAYAPARCARRRATV